MAEDSIPYGASHDDNGNRVCTPLWLELAIVRVRRLENDSGEGTARIIISFSSFPLWIYYTKG